MPGAEFASTRTLAVNSGCALLQKGSSQLQIYSRRIIYRYSKRTEQIRLSDLARLASASAALASRVLARLAELKLVTVHGSGPNRFLKLSDPGGLLDTWANEELQAVQTTYLYVWSGSQDKLIKNSRR